MFDIALDMVKKKITKDPWRFFVLLEAEYRKASPELVSPAMTTLATKGGIDLTPANMNLQTQNPSGVIKFHMDSIMLKQLQNAPGFVPVIINIQPMTDLRLWLGLNDQKPASQKVG